MPASRSGIELHRLWWIGPLTVVAANAAVLAVRVIAFATLDLSHEFPPLTWSGLIVFTTVLVTFGVLVFAASAMLRMTMVSSDRTDCSGWPDTTACGDTVNVPVV